MWDLILGKYVVGEEKGKGVKIFPKTKTNNANETKKEVKRGKVSSIQLLQLMMMAADGWYVYNGREAVPLGVTRVRIHESLTVIPADAFDGNRSIEELECHDRVKTVGERAFCNCPSLRLVRMPGVEVVERGAFSCCKALADVECGKLEIIGGGAFWRCTSLTSINLPSAKIVELYAFSNCTALTNVEFGKELESIRGGAFYSCTSLERITIPLKEGMITADNIFQGCKKLVRVDLVEGEVLRDTTAALLLEEWRNDMNDKLGAINQILPTIPAGDDYYVGGKAMAIRRRIRSVLGKIVQYKAQHRSLLNEAATTLQLASPNDVVLENVLPFLKLPSYTFEGED
ncbi:leucine-rich repeat domain-containing protein [Skeletonema marinoi]|uniref:Leucine-rich repeat domain-containing protein n=1 Tax=Skeletonema marinoi TaxID=267567 RepID=A0AAD8XTS3_9STRA|nr:leucine-rich repeat domain-containing protein [Skeletonema marinoi]